MTRKRKGGATRGAGGKRSQSKKAKDSMLDSAAADDVQPEDAERKAILALKTEKQDKTIHKIDMHCDLANSIRAQVVKDYDCMLNQTNIGNNNNKFYVIQLIKFQTNYYVFNRWGRVGESGQKVLKTYGNLNEAVKDFEKKFQDKTKNSWSNRSKFVAKPGKYTLIEMDAAEEDEEVEHSRAAKLAELSEVDSATAVKVLPCSLDNTTQSLVSLIFDNDMFKEAMQKMDIDVKKMPLGKLSKSQIAKGFEVLEELEVAIKNNQKSQFDSLTSRFYTLIPHNFGRQRPPIISTFETIRNKKDMLLVLADIEIAQDMQKQKKPTETGEEVKHPLDEQYEMLKCDLKLVSKASKEYKVIQEYTDNTGYCKIANIWKVNRHDEGKRFKAHEKLGNRKLLWHGTNVAVVAAILKDGLRIMPHSGGRVGKGIYFASENSKSFGYVGLAKNRGIMFLNEVVLGNEHHIMKDDYSLTSPPEGYNSVIAKGHTEPDPKKDTDITLEGKKIVVPVGKPININKWSSSNFSQTEYLVYREDQCRIRYLVEVIQPGQ